MGNVMTVIVVVGWASVVALFYFVHMFAPAARMVAEAEKLVAIGIPTPPQSVISFGPTDKMAQVRSDYVSGLIEVEEFEAEVDRLLPELE